MPDVAAGHELVTAIAIGDATDLDGGDALPLLGEVFGERLIVGEGDRDVDLIGLGVSVWRADCSRTQTAR